MWDHNILLNEFIEGFIEPFMIYSRIRIIINFQAIFEKKFAPESY
jgi:hypothetical protein